MLPRAVHRAGASGSVMPQRSQKRRGKCMGKDIGRGRMGEEEEKRGSGGERPESGGDRAEKMCLWGCSWGSAGPPAPHRAQRV